MSDGNQPNLLYYGDNLDILRRYVKDKSVDLLYLDPPFNSNQNYNVLFKERGGSLSDAQIHAFEDTWKWGLDAERALKDVVEAGGTVSQTMQAFRTAVGTNDMLAYLAMMAPRLVELSRVLKPTGSIYLHCDPTASHYLKILMDAVFGPVNFRTEIVWKRSSAHSDAKQGRKQHGRIHDVILFYTKGDEWEWNQLFTPYDEGYTGAFYKYVEPETGRRYRLGDLTGPGGEAKGNPKYEVLGVTRYWRYTKEKMDELIRQGRVVQTKPGAVPAYKRYLDEMSGVPIQDMWTDINPIGAQAAERMGYPTQKPETLLKRIIETSSKPGELVLDPFSGCGTAVVAAQRLGRRWIGIDITHLAINLMKRRLRDTFGNDAQFQVIGEPVDVTGAQELAHKDPYQFQWWALGLVDARPVDGKKGADKGIDGRIYFHDEADSSQTKQVIFSVKAGHTNVAHVRDLNGVLTREGAAIGVLISMEDPTQPMIAEAASAGFYHSPGWNQDYPRIQLRTIAELLAGKGIDVPPQHVTFKQAPKHVRNGNHQLEFTPATSDADAETIAVCDRKRKSRRAGRSET
jgi:DNA modification methylase